MILTTRRTKLVLLFFLVLITGFLSLVFLGKVILPQTLGIGHFEIRFYGLVLALAVSLAYWLAKRRAGIFNISPKDADEVVFWVMLSGFIGARLYHIFSSFAVYVENPSEVLKVWHGGLSIYGAVFGGLVGLMLCVRFFTPKYKISLLLDWLTPTLAMGQVIGRFGNLFNYEVLGYPTMLPWKMFVPESFRPPGFFFSHYFHPWFLYEQLWVMLVFFALIRLEKQKNQRVGMLFIFYLLLYNAGRFFLEFLRVDSTFVFGQFRQNSLVSLLIVFVCFLVYIRYGRKADREKISRL